MQLLGLVVTVLASESWSICRLLVPCPGLRVTALIPAQLPRTQEVPSQKEPGFEAPWQVAQVTKQH